MHKKKPKTKTGAGGPINIGVLCVIRCPQDWKRCTYDNLRLLNAQGLWFVAWMVLFTSADFNYNSPSDQMSPRFEGHQGGAS